MTWQYVNGRPPSLAKRQADPGFRIRLVTVPHTGTFFTRGLLERMGVTHDHSHMKLWTPEEEAYWKDRPNHKSWIVCTLLDPMEAHASAVNQSQQGIYHVEAWKILALWQGEPNVHFFSVDGPQNERVQNLKALADFAGAEVPSTDWKPVNAMPDTLGIKADYRNGIIRPEIQGAFDALSRMDDVKGLFDAHGYSLPWMN